MARIGMVLSGGMARGAYQLGALKCISKYLSVDQVSAVSASSIGTLNAYAFVADKLELAERLWLGIDIKGSIRAFRELSNPEFVYGIVDTITDKEDSIPCNFYTDSININKAKLRYIDIASIPREDRADYLKASVSFPLLSRPYKIGKSRYCDGALVDDIPVFPLKSHELDYIIMIYFDKKSYVFECEEFDSKIIKINFYDAKLIKNYLRLDGESIRSMIAEGYEKTDKILGTVFENGIDDTELISRRIRELNSCSDNTERRISGDVVLRNFNRFVQRVLPKIRDEQVIGSKTEQDAVNLK